MGIYKQIGGVILGITMCVLAGQGCRKDMLYTNSSAQLQFSTDTVQFDTVFSSVGSATYSFKVFNPYTDPINISSIRVAGGESSQFRINVDGLVGSAFTDIEIPAQDSIYIFVEVTVDPNAEATPYVIEDSILFETNGNSQQVQLVSWGQNAFFHNGQVLCDTVWNDELPHIIYNSMLVDSLCTLTINKGCRIYVHSGSSIFVKGKLIIAGEKDSTVTIQGDRLEDFYSDIPGQWEGIYFLRGSLGNNLSYCTIKNASTGIASGFSVSSLLAAFNTDAPEVTINNTSIYDIQNNGIFSLNSNISATNTLIYNCGESCAALTLGGQYTFTHCTLADYSSTYLTHQTPTLILTNYYAFAPDIIADGNLDNTNFINCIVYGSLPEGNEIAIDTIGAGTMNYLFNYCVLRTNYNQFSPTFSNTNCKLNDEPYFDIEKRNYCPALPSFAINNGTNTGIPIDIVGAVRPYNLTLPDIGCYETTVE